MALYTPIEYISNDTIMFKDSIPKSYGLWWVFDTTFFDLSKVILLCLYEFATEGFARKSIKRKKVSIIIN